MYKGFIHVYSIHVCAKLHKHSSHRGVSLELRMYVCVYVCMYVYMHVCIYEGSTHIEHSHLRQAEQGYTHT
jgi:hypothetical protein